MEVKYVFTGKTFGEVLDEREALAREEGIEEGMNRGGVKAIQDLIDNLCNKFGMTEEEALEYIKGAGFPERLQYLQGSHGIDSLGLGDSK